MKDEERFCDCMYWARAELDVLTEHHPLCEKFDPNEIVKLPEVKISEEEPEDNEMVDK